MPVVRRPARPPRHRWFAAAYDLTARLDDRKIGPVRRFVAGEARGRVLELGCGTGLNFAWYDWQRVESLVALEPDSYMLARARARRLSLPPAGRQKTQLLQAMGEGLPFPDAVFDSVVATLVFCTVASPRLAIAEVGRVLRPGGELRLFEHVRADGFLGRLQGAIQPVYGWLAAGCDLRRDTEALVREGGLDLAVNNRLSPGPLWPAFVGVARRRS